MKKIQIIAGIFFLIFLSIKIEAQNSVTLSFNSSLAIDSIRIYNLSNNSTMSFKSTTITLDLESSNGVKNIQQMAELKAYPNPFKQEVNIDIPLLFEGKTNIVITDLSGKEIVHCNKQFMQGSHRIIFKPANSGVYFVKISDNFTSYTSKLICTESGSSQAEIKYLGEITNHINEPNNLKAVVAIAPTKLKVALGDRLEFTGYSNSKIKTFTDTLKANKNYSIDFTANLWQLLTLDSRLDSIRNYLYSFDRILLNEARSTPGEINELGQLVYTDSVVYNGNKMFNILGNLDSEDSNYTVIWPTNEAWIRSYDNLKEYYRYYSVPATKYTADTLQINYTRIALVQDLVFSNKMQVSPNDYMVSTANNVFYNAQNLFEGAEKVNASNGVAYLTDELKYNHWQSWNQEILVEAEKSKGRTNTWSNLYERTYSGNTYSGISGNQYIEVNASTTSVNPTVQFEIPNILSGKLNADSTIAYGAAYNIYCVLLPSVINSATPKPNKVKFSLMYKNAQGYVSTLNYDNNKLLFITDKNKMSKILVASKVTFPFSEKGLDNYSVLFKVSSNVTAQETVEFTRDLFIDCVIFEPVH